ncbi:MAG: hypothetical protein HY869_20865 [Chloroflexi bacterium]|nr:hypothetical protein [Chloroflexota bacterium]
MHTYFANCTTLEEAKSLYRQLALKHHPDRGGDLATMQAINAEYADFLANFAKRDARERQQKAHTENRKSAADFHDMDAVSAELKAKIEFALNLDGVEVELMGLWVWLTGNTKAHKDAIKAQGFKWSPEKTAWYFAGVPSFNRQRRTLDEIRNMHGSTRFTRDAHRDEQREEHRAEALHA